jgi:hypothetical protein
VREISLGHKVVSLEDAVNVRAVDADCNAHDHVLWAFGDTAIDVEEVGAFKCFETEAKDIRQQ